jgi:hypothetical protein
MISVVNYTMHQSLRCRTTAVLWTRKHRERCVREVSSSRPGAGLDAEAWRKIICPCRESNPGHPVRRQTQYWLSYSGSHLSWVTNKISLQNTTPLLPSDVLECCRVPTATTPIPRERKTTFVFRTERLRKRYHLLIQKAVCREERIYNA